MNELVARCTSCSYMAVWESVEPKPGDACEFCGETLRLALESWTSAGWSGGAS